MIPAEKQILRKQMKTALDAFAEKAEASQRIHALLRATPAWQEAKVIYGFSPLISEPDWYADGEAGGKILAFPKTEETGMRFFVGGKMAAGAFRIMEPDAGDDAPPPDLILVPALAYDLQGYRLGRGGGYYDRFLEAFQSGGCKTIGLCFACQMVEKLPREIHDAKVDAVLTEKGLTST